MCKKGNKRLHMFVKILVLTLLLVSMCSFEKGQNEDVSIEVAVGDIIEEFKNILPGEIGDIKELDDVTDKVGFKFLIENIVEVVKGGSGELLSFFVLLFGSVILMSIPAFDESETGRMMRICIGAICTSVILVKFIPIINEMRSSLGEVNSFFSSLIPITAAVNMLGMSASTASVQSLGMNLSLSVLSFVTGEMLMSVIGIMIALSVASLISGGAMLRIFGTVRKSFMTVIGIASAVFGGVFSLQSILSSYADTVAIRTARFAASNMIPIVGSTVSGALSTVAGGVAYAKGIVGGGAIAVIASVLLSPLVTLIMYRLCFSVAAFIAGLCSSENESFISLLGGVLDSLIAIYSLTAVIYVIELAVFLKGGAELA